MDLAVNENTNDIGVLESALMADIAAAADEQAIEAVRVAALGKKGSVSEMLKTLGAMSAEERQTKGPAINGLKNRVTEALTARRAELRDAAIAARLAAEKVDVTLPVRPVAGRARPHPPDQPGDRRDHRDLRRSRLLGRRRAGHRDRLLQFHGAEFPRRPSGARDARHLLLPARPGRASASCCAPTPRRCRSARWRRRSRRSASSSRARPTGRIPTRRTRRCSIRSRGWSSTGPPTSPT